MAAETWPRIAAVFEEIASLPTEARPQGLDRLCGEDLELRREVEALLAADRAAGDFLERPAVSVNAPSSWVGRQLGAYRLERKLGEGGMGAVYLAARADQEYERQVAVKVFSHGVEHADLLQRFRAERQILASLDHPGIARLLDGGTTDDGLPYLVMEHIDGLPIDRYCDERQLTIDERIGLFLKVCDAVAYAHRNLVVHRDLKPSNILVTADGSPRLLDFGIAKLLAGAAVSFPQQKTLTGERLMTPPFASPEQITGGAITTASDVYTLGVVLYLLLTGNLPYRYDPQRLGALETAVVEQEPIRPSLAVEDPRLSRKLAGDLDNIVLKALAKEPRRRYSSVESLAQDLHNYREGLPVAARAATTGYRLRKFLGRHRLAAAATAATSVLILGLAVAMTVQAVSLARQRDEIRHERDKAVQVTKFLQEMFRSPDPSQAQGEKVTAREILDTGAARIRTELKDQPETQAALMNTMGAVYHNLGLDDRARPLLERGLALRRQHAGKASLEAAESLDSVGQFHRDRGELAAAETEYRQALEIRRATQGEKDPAVARTLDGLALTLMERSRYAAAEPLFQRALAIDRAHFGSEHEETAETVASLGRLRESLGDLAGAELLLRQALGTLRRVRGEAYPPAVALLDDLGELLVKRGRFVEAEACYRESLKMARKLYGEEHLEVAIALNNLAFLYLDWGKPAPAEASARQSVAILRKLLGKDNPKMVLALNNLARSLEEQGNLAAAQPLYEEAISVGRKTLGEKHPDVAIILGNLANNLAYQGHLREAEALERQVLAIRRETLGEAHLEYGIALTHLAGFILARGAPAEAEQLVRQGYQVIRKTLSDGHWRTADTESFLGKCLFAQGKLEEAQPLLVDGYRTLNRTLGPGNPLTVKALKRIVEFYEKQGDARRAALYRSKMPA
jgi:eukaryotic-like serine/threonine-protein kinase